MALTIRLEKTLPLKPFLLSPHHNSADYWINFQIVSKKISIAQVEAISKTLRMSLRVPMLSIETKQSSFPPGDCFVVPLEAGLLAMTETIFEMASSKIPA